MSHFGFLPLQTIPQSSSVRLNISNEQAWVCALTCGVHGQSWKSTSSVIGDAIAGDDRKHQVDFEGTVILLYSSDAFGRGKTVLVDKDYKDIKAFSLMILNAKILLCKVHAHRVSRYSISAPQCDNDDACKLFRSKMHAPNTRVYDECVAFLRGAYPPGRGRIAMGRRKKSRGAWTFFLSFN